MLVSEQQVLRAAQDLRISLLNLKTKILLIDIEQWSAMNPEECRTVLQAVISCKSKAQYLECCIGLCIASVLRANLQYLDMTADQSGIQIASYRKVCKSSEKEHLQQRLALRNYLQDTFIPSVQKVLDYFPQIAEPRVSIAEVTKE